MITACWQAGDDTTTGAIGCAIALSQAASISPTGAAHAGRIDVPRGRERARHDRDVVAAAGGVGDVGEQERAALRLGEPALELPPHPRVQLAVLVDRAVDADEQALRLQRR